MLQFQPTVRVGYFGPQLAEILHAASIWGLQSSKPVVVYSIQDLQHNPGSLHPLGLAVDLDVLGNNPVDLASLYDHLRVYLPPGYDVVWEGNHVHVEYDMKRPKAPMTPPPAGGTA